MDCSIMMLSIDELLIIFKHLDAKTLKNAALVCKNWYDIISNSISIMAKFKISSNKFKTYDQIKTFKRVIHTLLVRADNLQMFRHICLWHGSQIRSLCILNYQFSRPKEFHDVLRSMPLLEELYVCIVTFIEDSDTSVQPVEMKCLKVLEVFGTAIIGFDFRFLLGSQPKSLRLINEDNEMIFLNEFLETLVRLESLSLRGTLAMSTFLKTKSSKLRFKLKKLEMDWCRLSGVEGHERSNLDISVCDLMCFQSSSLEDLSLHCASHKVVEKALTSFQFLKVLKLISCDHPTEKCFYDSLKPLSNLKELYIDEPFRSEIIAKGTLRNCPMLVTLELQCWDIIPMTVNSFIPEFGPDMKFLFLKNLRITGGDISRGILFLKNNSTIENIGRSYVNPSEELHVFVDTLVNMPRLKQVEVEGLFDTLKVIYDGFSYSEHSHSKSVILIFDDKSRGFPKVKFSFPQDAGQWDAKCGEFNKTPGARSEAGSSFAV